MGFFDGLGSSIIGTIGGLFGAKMNNDAAADQNKAIMRMNKTKIQTTVKDARAAGIHPLAALGSPVAGSWATPVSQPGYGDAVADGAARIGSSLAPEKAQARALADAALATERAKVRNLDADTASKLADAQRTTLTAAARRGGQSLDVANLSGSPDPVQPVTVFGKKLVRDPKQFSSADRASQEYGEVAEHLVGLPSMLEAATRDWMFRYNVNNAIRAARRKENRSRAPSTGNWSVP